MLFLSVVTPLLGFSNLVYGRHDDSSTISATSTTISAVVPTASDSVGLTGDSQCPGSKLMCITATINASTLTYELQSESSQMKWMAVGFGSQMAGSSMVIMWPNADNTITLSQRQANGEVMPTPDPSPARIATVATPLSTLSGAKSKLTFTIDASSTSSSHIYAFGIVAPSSADPSSPLQQHLESGVVSLDLSKPLSSSSPLPTSGSPTSGKIPLLPYQKMIIAHAIVTTFGFLFLLPLGVLFARYTRTFSTKWFTGHWIFQGALGGTAVILGCILAFVGVSQHGTHTLTRHKSIGIALLAMYLVQASLGVFIHTIKIPFRFGRPPQNYAHAILGLTTIALALYQVQLGFSQEWPNMTGRGPVNKSVNIVWMVWVILLPVLYFGGLVYLPRQLRQERKSGGSIRHGIE